MEKPKPKPILMALSEQLAKLLHGDNTPKQTIETPRKRIRVL